MYEESIYKHLPLGDHELLFPFVTVLPLLHYVDHGWFTITPPLMCADHGLGGRLPPFKSLLSGDHVMLRVHTESS